MSHHPRSIKRALAVVVLLGFGAFLWWPIRQAQAVGALEEAMDVPEGHIILDSGADSWDKPVPWVPAWVDSSAEKLVAWFVPLGNPDARRHYLDEFRMLFRGPVNFVGIWGKLDGDPGAVLQRFPHLWRVQVDSGETTEADWVRFCMGLRECAQLEEVHFGGRDLTDAGLAPLAGHPTLSEMSFHIGHLTPASVETFTTMPMLERLHVYSTVIPNENIAVAGKFVEALKAALPQVKVEWTLWAH